MPPNKDDDDDSLAIRKFAQLYTLFNQRREDKYFDSYLQDHQINIDYQVPEDDFLLSRKPEVVGCTALHLAVDMERQEIARRLLDLNADFTLKNRDGSTALHRAVEDAADERRRSGWRRSNGKLDDAFVRPILARHVLTKNTANPSNKHGLAHFHAACAIDHAEALEFFLDNGADVDQRVNADSPIFAGYTGLHFAARCCAPEAMRTLLKRGADFGAREAKGMTALHLIVQRNAEISGLIDAGREDIYENVAEDLESNAAMMGLLAEREPSYDQVGLSRLHVACTTRDISTVERVLKQEENVDIDRAVNFDSPVWPGYTPLHFAATFGFEIVRLLLRHGANLEAKDAKGVTPLDMCLERYGFEEIHHIISSHEVWSSIVLSDGDTKLVDLVRAMKDLEQFDALLRNVNAKKVPNRLDLCIPEDSALWPGDTLLHLAVRFYDASSSSHHQQHLRLIDECLRLGAEVSIKNAAGLTPLHLAFRAGREDAVERMLQHHHSPLNPVDAGDSGLSHLHVACAAGDKFTVVNLLMTSNDDVDLPLRAGLRWYGTLRNPTIVGLSRRCVVHLAAGSTPLHVAVQVGSSEVVEYLVRHGADLYAKDVDGLTPVHRVLTSCDRANVGRLLLVHPPIRECRSDELGLSHLHVASLANDLPAMTSLLDDGTDVNVAVAGESSRFSKNVSVDACDNPFTYVSSVSISRDPGGGEQRMSVTIDQQQRSVEAVDPYGEAAAKYLDRYAGFTPLHFALRGNSREAVKLLLDRGADILARANGLATPLYDCLNCVYNYLEALEPILKSDAAIRERVREDTGVTMLHVACHKIDVDAARELLAKDDVDVNATTREDSPCWPGCGALHVLMTRWERDMVGAPNFPGGIIEILRMLLDAGADVSRRNAENDTPLHVADRLLRGCDGDTVDSPARICVNLLLRKHADFTSNPVNSRGYSFFHVACRMNDAGLVREYLNHGVDVNRPIGYFADERAGESPLILAAGSLAKRAIGPERQLEVIDLLLEHGADVRAEDAFGNTPLHAAAGWGSSREGLLERLVSHGANMYAKNIFGDTPLERLLRSFRTSDAEVEVFLRRGFSANSFNDITDEGYMSMLFSRRLDNVVQMSIFEAMLRSSADDVARVDAKARTALHNVVSSAHPIISDDDFVDLIEKLTGHGIDVDAQDETGKTPLHTATKFRNHAAVSGLLKCGADVDVLDANSKPAFAYFLEPSDLDDDDDDESVTELTIKAFVFHLQKLQRCGLEFSRLNAMIRDRAREKYGFEFDFDVNFDDEIAKAKSTTIGSRSLVALHDFLSETGAVAAYPTMTQLDRDAAREFFQVARKFTLHREFRELAGLLKLQYRKAARRLLLAEPAKIALLGLIPCALPDLCSEAVLRFLANSELAKLIAVVLQATRARKRMRTQ